MAGTKVGVVQITSGPEVEPNLQATERVVRGAAADGAQLVVVPECFAYLGPEGGQRDVAEPLPAGGPILERCQRLAREARVELVLGGFWEQLPGSPKVANACIHLRADGTVAAIYRKMHLFDVDLPDGTTLTESDTVVPGTEPVVTETPFGTLGLSVCYDLRFPELYRALVAKGAIALAVPAAFTLATGKDHWHVLLRARAIEQQCYVLAAAQTGHHYGQRVSYGHALVVDPWGTVLAECGEGEGWAVATLHPERVAKVRASLPSLRHRVLG
jgi:deaminated glutathione amidase